MRSRIYTPRGSNPESSLGVSTLAVLPSTLVRGLAGADERSTDSSPSSLSLRQCEPSSIV